MDKQIVEQKIESLRKCLLRVEQRCPESLEDLLGDVDTQDASPHFSPGFGISGQAGAAGWPIGRRGIAIAMAQG